MSIKGSPISVRKRNIDDTSIDEALAYANVLPLSNNLYGLAGMNFGVYRIAENSVIVGAGSTQSILEIAAHGAKKHDIIRFKDAAFAEHEVSIKRIIDADFVELYGSLEVAPSDGDLVDILRPVLPRFTDTGATLATVQSGPITIKVDGVDTIISVDTAVPANTVPMPVQLYGVNGTLNITSDDLNVQLSHTGATPDSVQVGDGTNLLGINASNEAQVSDADALIALGDILASIGDPADVANGDSTTTDSLIAFVKGLVLYAGDWINFAYKTPGFYDATFFIDYENLLTSIDSSNDELVLNVGDVTDAAVTNPASNASIIAALKGLLTINAAMSAKLPAALGQAAEVASLSVALATEQDALLDSIATDIAAIDATLDIPLSNLETELQVIAALDFATEATLAAMSAKLPAALGQTTKADSLSVTMASDQENFGTEEEPGNGGSYGTATLNSGSASTLTAPTGAIGFVLSNDVESEDSIRYKIGAAPTAGAGGGMALLPGGSTAFIPCAEDVQVIRATGTCYANIQWVTRI
jgi:hypothetical protein